MSQTATNVTAARPAVGGAVYRAPLGTTAPTDASTALANTFVPLGYCSEDGLTNSISRDSTEITAWGGDTVLTIQTGKEDRFSFTLLEALNEDVLKTVYGESNVTGSHATGLTVKANADEPTEYVWVFDMITRENSKKRIVLPDAKMTDLADITYSGSDAVSYNITLTAMADSSGNTHYEYNKAASSSGT